MNARVIVIVGPTAGGKSDLAVALAQRLPGGGQVISADSMQVYRHMDAGTAKPSPALRLAVPHHGVDIAEPTHRFTVADWLGHAEPIIADLLARQVWPVVVGGTNLYLKALLEGMFDGPGMDAAIRRRLEAEPLSDLHARLRRIDPAAAARIHIHDRKRLVRALEVYELTGRPISQWQTQWDEGSPDQVVRPYHHDPILIGLAWSPEAVNRRINLRVKAMFFPNKAREQDGLEWWPCEDLVSETRRLQETHLLGPQAREALGYKQVLTHLAGQGSLEDAFEQTKVQTRRFAKMQRTWLKRFRGVHWFEPERQAPEALAAAILAAIMHARP